MPKAWQSKDGTSAAETPLLEKTTASANYQERRDCGEKEKISLKRSAPQTEYPVGTRVKCYWPLDEDWYSGTVTGVDNAGRHQGAGIKLINFPVVFVLRIEKQQLGTPRFHMKAR